jgi:hypothetical protein
LLTGKVVLLTLVGGLKARRLNLPAFGQGRVIQIKVFLEGVGLRTSAIALRDLGFQVVVGAKSTREIVLLVLGAEAVTLVNFQFGQLSQRIRSRLRFPESRTLRLIRLRARSGRRFPLGRLQARRSRWFGFRASAIATLWFKST